MSYLIGLAYGRSGSGSRKKVIERLFGQRISRGTFNYLVNSNVPVNFPASPRKAP